MSLVRHRVKRHPIPIVAHLRHSLVLAYALPIDVLARLVPPGLAVDAYGGNGFVAIALVQADRLRPAGVPARLGRSYALSGYRIFVRHRDGAGRLRRGLHIVRSDTNRRTMAIGGNLLTRYGYRLSAIRVREAAETLEVEIRTRDAEADLHVVADLAARPAAPPPGSPFARLADARRFAGPLPWTFDHEPETRAIVMVRGRRSSWQPRPVAVDVAACTFFRHRRFAGATPVLANAFHVAGVDYRWDRGVRVPVER